ncbi:MAG: hypothetical protein HYY24_12030 [Verrucomicrobia bacterium]|nr:hypothetical protein [Verrucomicrobiota bacterium]
MRAADEVVEFLARQIPADTLLGFRPSDATRQRVWQLVQKEKDEGLTPDEQCELDEYERLEHLLILAKAKARSQAGHAEGLSESS